MVRKALILTAMLLLAGCTKQEWDAWIAQGDVLGPTDIYSSTVHTPSGTYYGTTVCGGSSCDTTVSKGKR